MANAWSATDRRLDRRRLLRSGTIVAVGALAGCLEDLDEEFDLDGTTDEVPDADGVPADDTTQSYERAIHERVNEVRQTRDRDALAFNEEIAAVAREHSVDMGEREYFAHESPDGEGAEDRMVEFFPGYCRGIGENLASVEMRPDEDAESVAERVVSGWMDSPGHRENVLRDEFDEEGIGVSLADDRVLATQKLCTTSG